MTPPLVPAHRYFLLKHSPQSYHGLIQLFIINSMLCDILGLSLEQALDLHLIGWLPLKRLDISNGLKLPLTRESRGLFLFFS